MRIWRHKRITQQIITLITLTKCIYSLIKVVHFTLNAFQIDGYGICLSHMTVTKLHCIFVDIMPFTMWFHLFIMIWYYVLSNCALFILKLVCFCPYYKHNGINICSSMPVAHIRSNIYELSYEIRFWLSLSKILLGGSLTRCKFSQISKLVYQQLRILYNINNIVLLSISIIDLDI